MPKIPLTCDTIGDRALQEAVSDTDDRGEQDGKVRKTVITIEQKKLASGNVTVSVEVKNSLPAYRDHGTIADVNGKTGRAQLSFQSQNPDNPQQPVFDQLDEDEAGE